MMITLRKLPLAVAVAAGVMSAQAMAVDFHGYARSGIGWTGSGGEQQCFQTTAQLRNLSSPPPKNFGMTSTTR